jgi:hypothetical protein
MSHATWKVEAFANLAAIVAETFELLQEHVSYIEKTKKYYISKTLNKKPSKF